MENLKVERRILEKYIAGLINHGGEEYIVIPSSHNVGDDRYNFIFKTLNSMQKEKVPFSPEIIISRLKDMTLKIGSTDDWAMLEDWFVATVYAAEEVETSIEETKELQAIVIKSVLDNYAKDKVGEALEENSFSQEVLDKLVRELNMIKAVYPTNEALLDDQLEEAMEYATNRGEGMIKYGFKPIDDHIGGISRKEITILAGRPGHGKTSITCQFLLNWLESGMKVLFVSREMPTSKLMHKLLANIGRISSDEMKRGNVSNINELRMFADSITSKYRDKLVVVDNVYTIGETETLAMKHKPDIVIDDFIQCAHFGKFDMRTGILDALKRYKLLAKELDCAMFVISQLNRSIEGREDPMPRMSDLAESGSLEQLAADVCFIYYPFKVTYEDTDRNRVRYIITKARYGGEGILNLGFDGNHMRYYDIPNFAISGGNQNADNQT